MGNQGILRRERQDQNLIKINLATQDRMNWWKKASRREVHLQAAFWAKRKLDGKGKEKKCVHMLCRFSCVWLSMTPWTAARQAPQSTEFSR